MANPAECSGGRGGHNSWLGAKLLWGWGDAVESKRPAHNAQLLGVKVVMGPEFHASGAWQTVETRAVTIH